MIYIIMSTILVIAIIFLLLGSVAVTEETKNNNDKGTDTDGTQPNNESGAGVTSDQPAPVSEQRVSKPRAITKKRSVQPSSKRTSTATKRKAISKGLTISSAPVLNGRVVVKKKTIKK